MVSNYVYVGVMIITLIDMVQLHHDAIDYFVTRGGVYDGRGRDIQFIVWPYSMIISMLELISKI